MRLFHNLLVGFVTCRSFLHKAVLVSFEQSENDAKGICVQSIENNLECAIVMPFAGTAVDRFLGNIAVKKVNYFMQSYGLH